LSLRGDYVDFSIVAHGQVFFVGYHRGYKKELQVQISKEFVKFYRSLLQLPENYTSDVGTCYGEDDWYMTKEMKKYTTQERIDMAEHMDRAKNERSKSVVTVARANKMHRVKDGMGSVFGMKTANKIHKIKDENGLSKHAVKCGMTERWKTATKMAEVSMQ